jgi:hypothetical protein
MVLNTEFDPDDPEVIDGAVEPVPPPPTVIV